MIFNVQEYSVTAFDGVFLDDNFKILEEMFTENPLLRLIYNKLNLKKTIIEPTPIRRGVREEC